MFQKFWHEFVDEAEDFFEDFGEFLFHIRRHPRKMKRGVVGGIVTTVRPAYLFAERIDNLLKIIFGVSIVLSAFTTTFIGFTKLSDLLEVLIFTIPGRIFMILIGLSYLMTAVWRLLKIPVSEPDSSTPIDHRKQS